VALPKTGIRFFGVKKKSKKKKGNNIYKNCEVKQRKKRFTDGFADILKNYRTCNIVTS